MSWLSKGIKAVAKVAGPLLPIAGLALGGLGLAGVGPLSGMLGGVLGGGGSAAAAGGASAGGGFLSSIGGVSNALQVGGKLLGAVGSQQEGQAGYEAGMANAATIEARTKIQGVLQARQAYQSQGTTVAQYGAAGLAQSGSVGDVIRQNARDAAFDAASIQAQGGAEAAAAKAGAKQSKKAGNINALGGIISAGAQLFG